MNYAIRYPFAGRNWLLHASLELSPDDMAGDFLDSWLTERLCPLALPDGISEKVHASAREAAAGVPAGVRKVRVFVFTFASHPLADPTWGFFRVVKNGEILEERAAPDYEIVFYLYSEGSVKLD